MKKSPTTTIVPAAGNTDSDVNKKRVRFKEENALRNLSHV
jgi:hypothetical protein